MILDNANKSISVVLAGAKTTNDCNCFSSYKDVEPIQGRTQGGTGSTVVNTNGATAVTVIPAPTTTGPSGGTVANRRIVEMMTIYNADTAAVTATVRLTNGTTNSTVITVVLGVNETLSYSEGAGFKTLTSSGATKSTQTGGSANQLKVVIPIATGLLASLANTSTYRVAVPYAFTVLSARFVADVPATTGSKLATLTLSTTAGAVTGGVMALTSANMTPTGNPVAATAISGANATGTAGQEVIITVTSVTAFVEGSGHVEVTLSNNS